MLLNFLSSPFRFSAEYSLGSLIPSSFSSIFPSASLSIPSAVRAVLLWSSSPRPPGNQLGPYRNRIISFANFVGIPRARGKFISPVSQLVPFPSLRRRALLILTLAASSSIRILYLPIISPV